MKKVVIGVVAVAVLVSIYLLLRGNNSNSKGSGQMNYRVVDSIMQEQQVSDDNASEEQDSEEVVEDESEGIVEEDETDNESVISEEDTKELDETIEGVSEEVNLDEYKTSAPYDVYLESIGKKEEAGDFVEVIASSDFFQAVYSNAQVTYSTMSKSYKYIDYTYQGEGEPTDPFAE